MNLLPLVWHGPLAGCVTLRVAHAPGMPGTFPPPLGVSDPGMHHDTCVTHVPWCMPVSLTSGFLWSRWRGKRSRHSRCMCSPQFCLSGKRPIEFSACIPENTGNGDAQIPNETNKIKTTQLLVSSALTIVIRLIRLLLWYWQSECRRKYLGLKKPLSLEMNHPFLFHNFPYFQHSLSYLPLVQLTWTMVFNFACGANIKRLRNAFYTVQYVEKKNWFFFVLK